MADGHDELAGGNVVVNAIDHAPAAEWEADTFVIACATGDRIAQAE
jgi:hypothetical protein